ALVQRRGRRWQLRRYAPELGSCEPTRRRDGRQVLVCPAWGLDGHEAIDIVDWNAPEIPTKVLDLRARSLTEEACEHPHHLELATLSMKEYRLEDLNGDGIDDIVVRAKVTPLSAEAVRAERGRPDFVLACACHRAVPRYARFYPREARLRIKPGC